MSAEHQDFLREAFDAYLHQISCPELQPSEPYLTLQPEAVNCISLMLIGSCCTTPEPSQEHR